MDPNLPSVVQINKNTNCELNIVSVLLPFTDSDYPFGIFKLSLCKIHHSLSVLRFSLYIFQVFENVTILFSDVVGFTTICSCISPMEVVSMLNAMYTCFDQLSERHGVYKVDKSVI
jgi:hypothetical protein